jgi:hypothetical protein
VGRIIWASSSDYIGRRNPYWIFFALGIVLYLSIPFAAQQVSVTPAIVWLVYFYAATMIIFTTYGDGFATIPAYLADMFGTRYVGGIHGRLLTAWSLAGFLGPVANTTLRERAIATAKLLEIAPPGAANPTPSLYNLTMYLMAALLAIALVANALMRPVHPKHLKEAETAIAG